jgi:hypothetical protein
MRRLLIFATVSIAVLSASGCSEQNAASRAAIADLQKREKALIEQCQKIATDRNILLSKLEAMKMVFDPTMKPEPEPDRSHECLAPDSKNEKSNVTAPIAPSKQKVRDESQKKGSAVKDFSECRDSDGAPCREFLTDEDIAEADRVLERKPARSLCWEEYCPCDPPRGGPDQLLCDSLRRGEIDAKMLSVGKSMRDVRRQLSDNPF